MNPGSYLPIRIIAFACAFFTVSAFVNLQPAIGGRLCPLGSTAEESNIPEKLMEEVWRYVKKPLISVGGKGATSKHGNSLRQLLDDHTVVKVKVNTKSFGRSLAPLKCPWQHRNGSCFFVNHVLPQICFTDTNDQDNSLF